MQSKRRVVITGMGIVSPVGCGVDHAWAAIKAGKSGVRAIDPGLMDVTEYSSKIGGYPINGTEPGQYNPDAIVDPREQRRMDKFMVYGLVAADEAIKDSGWTPTEEQDKDRTGVLIGSGIGGMQSIYETCVELHEKGPRRISPFFITKSIINMLSGHVSINYGFRGPNSSVVTACATGTHAIGDASRLIAYGAADVMVAGGAEAAICPIGMGGFCAMRALSTRNDEPTRASRPWDKGRDGFVIGEGAGVLVLEEYEHAVARGAKIYAEVVGYGMSGDSNHITAPAEDGNGGYRAMEAAIKDAGISASDIDYINAHGTSTPLGDLAEFSAVKKMFTGTNVSMSSTKSMTGHLLGAAGAVETIFSALAIRDNICPPTINLEDPEEVTVGFDLVPNVAKEKTVNYALSNSFGFGGTNASILLKKCQ